jgi:hypothetical protein
MKRAFTLEETLWFQKYEGVRAVGLFNMFDPRAQKMTGLTTKQYGFVLDNYDGLKKQHSEETA